MSVRQRADSLLLLVLSVLWLPGRILEEGVHAVASAPWADEIAVRFEPREGSAETVVQFRRGTPEWAIRAAHLAPEVAAIAAGLSVISWWVISGTAWWPQSVLDWTLLAIFGAQWLAIALPSAADMDHAAEGRDD